jgi:hypothetical protein
MISCHLQINYLSTLTPTSFILYRRTLRYMEHALDKPYLNLIE